MSLRPIRAGLTRYRWSIFLRDGETLHIHTEEISKEILGILQVKDAEMRAIFWQAPQPSPEGYSFRQNPFGKPQVRASRSVVKATWGFAREVLDRSTRPCLGQRVGTNPKPETHQQLLTIGDLAEYLQVARRTIYNWRSNRRGPRGLRMAGGHVRYRLSDVDAWLEEQRDQDEVHI